MSVASIEPDNRTKLEHAAELLQSRVLDGVYGLRGIPGERKLASELGVSYVVARKAVKELIDRDVLNRGDNGRLEAAQTAGRRATLRIAFLTPAFASQAYLEWHYALSQVLTAEGGVLCPVSYVQPNDPSIFEVLEGQYDGVFLILPVGYPRLFLDRLARHRRRVVVLWEDLSSLGIPCIRTSPARFVGSMLDHLVKLNHRRIDCFNAQPMNQPLREVIDYWRFGLEQRGVHGELHNYPVEPFRSAARGAYDAFLKLIDNGLHSTAYFCPTSDQVRGVFKACHDRGVRVGSDVSICGFGEPATAELMVPSLTTVANDDPQPYLRMGLQWIKQQGRDWDKPLVLEPAKATLQIGESTATARD